MLRTPETITCCSHSQNLESLRETETGCFGLRPTAQDNTPNPFDGDDDGARRDAVDESSETTNTTSNTTTSPEPSRGPKSCQTIHWRGRARRGVRRRDPAAPPPSTAA